MPSRQFVAGVAPLPDNSTGAKKYIGSPDAAVAGCGAVVGAGGWVAAGGWTGAVVGGDCVGAVAAGAPQAATTGTRRRKRTT